jgi:hypothetical protein
VSCSFFAIYVRLSRKCEKRTVSSGRPVGLLHLLPLVFVVAGVTPARAQSGATDGIHDNLFLLEEAYNQEPGVIQHIQSLEFNPGSSGWNYFFTEEWPVPTDRHQLSVTVPVIRAGAGVPAAIGDMLVNYRIQAVGIGGEGPLAVAPRLSVVLPTGDYRTGAGRGSPGLQLNLPVSIELSDRFVMHLNAGTTVTPRAKSVDGPSGTAVDGNAGLALVWQPLSWFNPLAELAYFSTEEIHGDLTRARHSLFVVNPGCRAAINFRSGLQIVPGLSAPIRFSANGTELSVLAYLSFEHPAWKPRYGAAATGGDR